MTPGISGAEHRQRLDSLQQKTGELGLAAFVVSSLESIFYLTGAGFEPLERPFFLIVTPTGPPRLLVPKLDQKHMEKAHGIEPADISTYREYPAPEQESWPHCLAELLPGGLIGVEPTIRREITDKLTCLSLQTMPLVEQLRLIKSPAEIEMIQRAAMYADFGVQRILATSYHGAMVAEGFAETRNVSARIIREVPDWDPLNTKVLMAAWAAPYSAMPHSVPDLEHRLLDGPHVALAFNRVNGYAAESERTFFTSRPSSEARDAFAAMLEARQLAFRLIRPGLPCSALDATVNDYLTQQGYGQPEQRLHRIGHGIGLGNHEGPWLAEGSEGQLRENMVISIEPGIYIEGLGGIRHSDTLLVTRDGYQLLTHLPTDLSSLILTGWNPLARARGLVVRRSLKLSG